MLLCNYRQKICSHTSSRIPPFLFGIPGNSTGNRSKDEQPGKQLGIKVEMT